MHLKESDMQQILKIPFFLFVSLVLISCSASSDNERRIAYQLDQEATSSKIFVVRHTGSPGIMNNISVIHNGRNVGDLGMKEALVSSSVEGMNYLTASMNGLAGLTTRDAPIISYESEPDRNRFFVIQLYLKSNGADLYFIEVNETQFKSVALKSSWLDYL